MSRADVEAFRAQEIGRPKRLTRCCKKPWARAAEGWACSVCGTPAPADAVPIGDATVNRLLAAMAAFGEWCLVEGRGYHTTNPWAKHEPLAEDQIPVPDLEPGQLERVLQALDGPEGPLPPHGARPFRFAWRQLVEFARETGLRKGELGRLLWEDVRKEERIAFVVSTKKRGRTKSRKLRPVVLSTRALQVLDEIPIRIDGLVFGKVPNARRAFATAARAAGLQRVWLHLFRHLFASRLAERGAGRHELTEAGGWSSGRMADRYTHARMERLRELVDADPVGPGTSTGRASDRGDPLALASAPVQPLNRDDSKALDRTGQVGVAVSPEAAEPREWPRWTGETRPDADGSKPASGRDPRPVHLYYSVAPTSLPDTCANSKMGDVLD